MSKIWQLKREDNVRETSMAEAFPFLYEESGIISLVGGGGKTTLMYHLAKAARDLGKRAIITTTTHIQNPGVPYFVDINELLRQKLNTDRIAVTGHIATDNKLSGLSELELHHIHGATDFLFIEADGAKRLPCKVPNKTEPVIFPPTNIMIGVMGLEALGRPLKEVCFRIEEAKKLLQTDENHILNTEDVANILLSSEGTGKEVGSRSYYIVLNKCDNEERLEMGEEIMKKLINDGRIDRFHVCLSRLL